MEQLNFKELTYIIRALTPGYAHEPLLNKEELHAMRSKLQTMVLQAWAEEKEKEEKANE